MKDENESLKKERFMSRKLRLTAWVQNYKASCLTPLPHMKPQLSKLTPQVRTKGNHTDYSITEPYICTVEYVGEGVRLR